MRALVRRFDTWLSRRYGVFEFSQAQGCLLRLQVAVAHRPLPLPDCRVERGDPVLQLHLWNERVLALATPTGDLGWAKTLQRNFLRSLGEVDKYLSNHPELAEVRAVGGVTVLIKSGDHKGGARLVERLGFTVSSYASPLGSFGEFWENLYSWTLIWAYNPASLPNHRLWSLQRKEFWISAEEFRHRFAIGDSKSASTLI